MKVKINKIEYVAKRTEQELDIASEPIYCFLTGVRSSFAIIPQWTTWKKEHEDKDEEIYRYEILEVGLSFEKRIEKWHLEINELSEALNGKNEKRSFVAGKILGIDHYGMRTAEQFFNDYNSCLEACEKVLRTYS